MSRRTILAFAFVVSATLLLTGDWASAVRKPKTKLLTIRGPHGSFVIGTTMCGSKSCITYSGAQTDVSIPGVGRHASLSWEIIRGDPVFTTPGGGTAYAADGHATITTDSSTLDMEFGGPSVINFDVAEQFALAKFAAALTGDGAFSDATGAADASIVLNLVADTVEWELVGNYTD